MQYPCNTVYRYFNAAEQENLDRFLENVPKPGKMYAHIDGNNRICHAVLLPLGTITFDTEYGEKNEKGNCGYNTPGATLKARVAVIAYSTPDGAICLTDSDEWVQWLGDDFHEEEAPTRTQKDDSPAVVNGIPVKMLKAYANAAVDFKTGKPSEEAQQWKPIRNR